MREGFETLESPSDNFRGELSFCGHTSSGQGVGYVVLARDGQILCAENPFHAGGLRILHSQPAVGQIAVGRRAFEGEGHSPTWYFSIGAQKLRSGIIGVVDQQVLGPLEAVYVLFGLAVSF